LNISIPEIPKSKQIAIPNYKQMSTGMCDILTHGDLWVNNLLWHNSRPNEVAAFIDWQLTQRASPMTDISYILLLSVEPELRHEMEADGTMLAHYLNALNGKLEEIGMPSALFGLEEASD
jgi:thiamine kinase-like enzyme